MTHYKTIDSTSSPQAITLSAFGGQTGDPIAAQLSLDGLPRLTVLAPHARRSSWNVHDELAFREAVRALACNHPELSGLGTLSVFFDPVATVKSQVADLQGEAIDRERCR
jgi:hypothetical protein